MHYLAVGVTCVRFTLRPLLLMLAPNLLETLCNTRLNHTRTRLGSKVDVMLLLPLSLCNRSSGWT